MRFHIFLTIIAFTALAVSCQIEDVQMHDMTEEKTIIHADINGAPTRTYIAEDGRTVYWSQGDALGVYTVEGSKNAPFIAETAENAYDGDFIGSLIDESPEFAYYPYCNQSGDYTAVKLFLSNEQVAESISDYNFMGSNTFVKTGTNDYAMEFRSVLSILEVRVDATDTPLSTLSLSSVKVEAKPFEGNDEPVTGEFYMNLTDLTTSFKNNTYDYAKLIWSDPQELSEGVISAYMFVNPDAFKKGTPINITLETSDGTVATVAVEAAKDFQPHTRYDFNLSLADLADKVTYEGNPIASLKFLQSTNTRLLESSLYTGSGLSNGQDYVNSTTAYDIEATYDEAEGLWTTVIPYLHDFSGLVASFATVEEGAKVYVNGVEQESGVTVNDFNEIVTYEVVDADGFRTSAKVKVVNTGLPVVTITGTVYSKATDFDDIEGTTTINIDGTDYTCGLRLRGNSTQNMPKKPYAFKLDSKAEVLGMPKHKRWVLLANWLDRTMLRNDIAFYLAHQTDTWAPHGKNVEVVLNGVHVGNYWLGEQIKIDENRLNIAEVDAAGYSTSDEVAANVGFLLECDVAADDTEIYFYNSSPVPFYVYIKDPGDASSYTGSSSSYGATASYTYIQDYFSTVGSALRSGNWSTVESMVDYKSFADHWIMTELTENQESKHPKSFYMHKDAGGKLCAGPAWDYDWGTFIPMESIGTGSSSAGSIKNYYTARYTMWYTYLFNDDVFVEMVKERWAAMKSGFDSALPYLDQQIEALRLSDTFNHKMWPCTGFNHEYPNFDESLTWDEATGQMRDALEARIEWLDGEIANL